MKKKYVLLLSAIIIIALIGAIVIIYYPIKTQEVDEVTPTQQIEIEEPKNIPTYKQAPEHLILYIFVDSEQHPLTEEDIKEGNEIRMMTEYILNELTDNKVGFTTDYTTYRLDKESPFCEYRLKPISIVPDAFEKFYNDENRKYENVNFMVVMDTWTLSSMPNTPNAWANQKVHNSYVYGMNIKEVNEKNKNGEYVYMSPKLDHSTWEKMPADYANRRAMVSAHIHEILHAWLDDGKCIDWEGCDIMGCNYGEGKSQLSELIFGICPYNKNIIFSDTKSSFAGENWFREYFRQWAVCIHPDQLPEEQKAMLKGLSEE